MRGFATMICRKRPSPFFHNRSFSTNPVTPDYTTSVDIDKIRLAKPVRKAWVPPVASGSLIPDTLAEMENDEEFQLSAKALRQSGQRKLTLEERKRRRRALGDIGVPSFGEFLAQQPQPLAVARRQAEVLQLNIGLYCNQACSHCHVESSPQRAEMMSRGVAERCLALLASSESVHTLDITGGAPELNAQFRFLVESARALERSSSSGSSSSVRPPLDIIDRCNLTVLVEPGQEDLVDFLAENKVRVAASLPCYSAKNVDAQRGNKVFERSLEGLAKLNAAGYGQPGTGLELDLVYNPSGGFLPPPQAPLEEKYKEELMEHFGVSFNALFTITNMPIKRFADFLFRRGELAPYMELLVRNFNPETVPNLMCTNTVSVGWDGKVYDCDFNQQLSLDLSLISKEVDLHQGATGGGGGGGDSNDPVGGGAAAARGGGGKVADVFSLTSLDDLLKVEVATDSHCFGCTAGMGSS
mmetsp:Transcript_62636/g.125473  ORF Transcript_62636/g.125473 Transcript_62636/m.125473 type:complete len:470 (+) Transcript_62636:136-1545(+)